jgi:hypothetical protein
MRRYRGGSNPSLGMVQDVLNQIQQLGIADRQKLYAEAYTQGDISGVRPDPNASAEYNNIVRMIRLLTESQIEALMEVVFLEGGRRKKSRTTRKKTRTSKKTRKASYRK